MSATTDVCAPSLSTAGFEDGLGRRSIRFDREVGGMLECLHLRPELRAFEPVLRATSARIASLADERFGRTRGFEKDPHELIVLSELPCGERLADIIDTRRSEEAAVSALDAAIGLLLQVMPALAKLHGIGVSHGTLAPGRIIVTATADVVLLDAIYAQVIERLALSRQTLWSTFGILTPPSAGPVRLDARADIAQAALSAAALALGRPLASHEPADLHLLVGELSDIAQIRIGERFADTIRTFFQTTLPRASQAPLSADALCTEIKRLADFIGVDTALGALGELVRSAPAIDRFTFSSQENDEEDGGNEHWAEAAIEETLEPERPTIVATSAPKAAAPAPPPPPVAPVAVRVPEPEPAPAPAPPPAPAPVPAPAATLPAEFLPVAAPPGVEPSPPRELATPVPSALPPLVSPRVQETFEMAASAPAAVPPLSSPPTSWVPVVTSAPWTPASSSVPPPPPAPTPGPPPAGWTVVTPIAPPAVPTLFAPPMPPNLPAPPAPPQPPLIAPPSTPVQLQPPQKLKLKSETPPGYAPARSTTQHAFERSPHSVPFLDRLAAEQQSRAPWKIIAAAVLVLVVGGLAGRDYLLGRTDPAPPPTQPAEPATKPVAAPTVGILEVKSLPAGARVLLDGDEVGVTPLTLESVSPGRHSVAVSTETASVRRTVRIEAGKTVSLDLSVFAGWIAVFSPIPLHISEQGKALGTTDSGRILLPPGRHTLTFTNTEYSYSATQTVEVSAGEERAVNVTPTGTVNLNAQPWAEVFVDGKRVGETPLANLEVPLGTREFLFKHPQYGERRTVTTVTTVPAAISVDFTKPGLKP